MSHYQLVVIGAGPGGYVAAIKAAQLGLKTAVIEQAEVGGTCLNRGCIPTKTLLHTAELLEDIQRAHMFGLITKEASVDYPALRERKIEVVGQLRGGVEKLLEANEIDLIRGKAVIGEFSDENVPFPINIKGVPHKDSCEDSDNNRVTIAADNIIIATGTTPAIPPIEGANLSGVYTSDTFLAELPELDRLVIIGGGVIGMEFATVYSAFGTKVTVLEAADHILPGFDRELSQNLGMIMKKRGCTIAARTFVKKIESPKPNDFVVTYEDKGEEKQIECDAVLIATGRKASIDGLFASSATATPAPNNEAASSTRVPRCDQGRIVVDSRCCSSIPRVYAIGDISTAGPELAHAASAQGIVAACTIAETPCDIKLDIVPSCVYTSPEIACVGLSEAEAKEAGIETKIGKYSLMGNAKSIITGQSRSFIKLVADQNGVLIGAQLMCARATDIIGELALGISLGLTASDMLSVMRAHPTYEEAVGEALEAIEGTSIHSLPRK